MDNNRRKKVNDIYLEHLKKIAAQKDLLERSLFKQGEYPDSAYVKRLLSDINTRYAILDYSHVKDDTYIDIDKFNDDFYCILKDLEILYSIVDELASKKFIELQAYVNAYLSSLEEVAERADERAYQSIESTTLNSSTVYYTDIMPAGTLQDKVLTIPLGTMQFSPQSKVYCTINGTGFSAGDVVFKIGNKKVSPYQLNGDTVKIGSTVTKHTYTYQLPDSQTSSAGRIKIANEAIKVNEHNKYRIYGSAGNIQVKTFKNTLLIPYEDIASNIQSTHTFYSFYLTDATKITFNLSGEPIHKNFSSYDIKNLKRDKIYYFEMELTANQAFSFNMDGKIYATKETAAVNDDELYVVNYTPAKDFIIYEYSADTKVSKNVSVSIYNLQEQYYEFGNISINEISDIEVNTL